MIGSKALLVLVVAGGILGTAGAAAAQETTNASDSATVAVDSQDPQAKPAPPSPEPEHTGLAAIVYKTGADFKAFPRRKSTWVILGIGGAAAALAHPADNAVNRRLKSDAAGTFFAPGKYIGSVYVQVGTAVGLYTIGRYVLPESADGKRTNKVSHLGFDLLRAAIVSQALTQGLKYSVRRDRPNGKANSFPSGHASATFATAAVLERHLGYRGAWPTIAIASYVAASRLHDNVHYLSDVVFGAALGTASGWTVVGRHGRSDYTFIPVPIRGGAMIALVKKSGHGDSPSAAPASQRQSHDAYDW